MASYVVPDAELGCVDLYFNNLRWCLLDRVSLRKIPVTADDRHHGSRGAFIIMILKRR